jgi:phage gp46-like protein
MWDLRLDPVTRDLVPDASGGFETTESAETAVMLALSSHFEKWWGDPDAGSQLYALVQGNDVNGLEESIDDEVRRALGSLVKRGRISIVSVNTYRSGTGRIVVETQIADNSTGQPVDVVVTPFGGF